MTQDGRDAARDAAPVGRGAPVSAAAESSPWAPLGQPVFRWLWLGVLISNVGIWMQTVGAQWLLVQGPNAAALVSLVQVASTLPVMLLALPAGVLADSFDRRWLLFAVQAYFFAIGILLAVLTALERMPPALLLAFTFAMGLGVAVQFPGWQSIIPELVPRSQLRAAARLDAVGVSVARAVGPALAGLVIARFGVPLVFALTAVSVVFFATALIVWQPQAGAGGRERFVPALRAGGRYVRHEPVVRRILLRAALFTVPAAGLWALLPVIASQGLGLSADGYGVLFGALGAGAVVGALVLRPVTARLSTNGMLGAAGVLYAVALAMIVLVPSFAVALAILVFAGLAWMATGSTLNAELQLFLPVWVRARGLAVLLVTFFGSQAVGAVVWGLVAERAGLQATMLIAAVVLLAVVVTGVVLPLPEIAHLDRQPAVYWTEARLAFEPEPDAGPVLVTVEYTVPPEREAAFLEAMGHLRRSRLRTGATRCELYRDADTPDRFLEIFSVPSWEEHMRQHEGRLTVTDQQIEESALAFSDPPPRATHLLPP